MHDVLQLEKSGIATSALVSDAFKPQAIYQGLQIGGGSVRNLLQILVWVKHPISDQTPSQMQKKGETCYLDVVDAISSERHISNQNVQALTTESIGARKVPAAECDT
ncbi:hypothetical protein AAMO2058_001710000 [Amorphochlora amoebiformis]|mmetsp:Transcript_4519/g.6850  ORF Transcript_4519/g.6850 Transcript_4519/m.6850 type:complete len:107 (-) Transcript_4519:394-714(-)